MINSTIGISRVALRSGFICAIAVFTLGAATLPNPAADESRAEKKTETVVLAGGCFWGIQAVFDAVKGVSSAVSGYAGGSTSEPQRRQFLKLVGASVPAAFALRTASAATTGKKTVRIVEFDASGIRTGVMDVEKGRKVRR